MNQLQDQLHRLADDLSAPPTEATRQAVGRRTHTLRRRRQARRAAAGTALMVALVVGAFAVRSTGTSGVHTGYSTHGDGTPPAWTLELDGWEVGQTSEGPAVSLARDAEGVPYEGSEQVFHRPGGELGGPTVVVHHKPASDVQLPPSGSETVPIGAGTGYLSTVDAAREWVRLGWSPAGGDSHAELDAFGLTQVEVLQVVGALQLKDDDINYPLASGDQLGFVVAGQLPAGMEEVPWEGRDAIRRVVGVMGPGSPQGGYVSIQADAIGGSMFRPESASVVAAAGGPPEEVTVQGEPAQLFGDERTSNWYLLWRDDDITVQVFMERVDRTTVDQIVGGLHPLSDEEWEQLRATTTGG